MNVYHTFSHIPTFYYFYEIIINLFILFIFLKVMIYVREDFLILSFALVERKNKIA